jgi:hypothetical protein
MNYIGIDPSLISTAVVINGDIINYCRESSVLTKSGMSKWFKSAEQYCQYKFIEYSKFESYSEGELTKLKDYDEITDLIIGDIISKIDISKETYIGIEGYNFGAQVGDLVDLVAFSTLLRNKLWYKVSKNITVFSPTSLKLEACKFTYQPIIKEVGKKVKRIEYEWRNPLGIPGGKFIKTDMARAIIDNTIVSNDKWFVYLKSIQVEILSLKNIPKPHEDINDAVLLYHIIRKMIENNTKN